MAERKVSIFKRGSRWGYMVRVDNKITKSGVADSRGEAERKAGGRGTASKKKPKKKPSRKAPRKKPPRRKAKKKAAKKKAPKRGARTRISAAGCVVAKKGKTGGRTYKKVCGRKAPKSAAKAAEILSEYGHGVSEGRKEKGCPTPKRGKRPASDGGRKALRAAIRRDC